MWRQNDLNNSRSSRSSSKEKSTRLNFSSKKSRSPESKFGLRSPKINFEEKSLATQFPLEFTASQFNSHSTGYFPSKIEHGLSGHIKPSFDYLYTGGVSAAPSTTNEVFEKDSKISSLEFENSKLKNEVGFLRQNWMDGLSISEKETQELKTRIQCLESENDRLREESRRLRSQEEEIALKFSSLQKEWESCKSQMRLLNEKNAEVQVLNENLKSELVLLKSKENSKVHSPAIDQNAELLKLCNVKLQEKTREIEIIRKRNSELESALSILKVSQSMIASSPKSSSTEAEKELKSKLKTIAEQKESLVHQVGLLTKENTSLSEKLIDLQKEAMNTQSTGSRLLLIETNSRNLEEENRRLRNQLNSLQVRNEELSNSLKRPSEEEATIRLLNTENQRLRDQIRESVREDEGLKSKGRRVEVLEEELRVISNQNWKIEAECSSKLNVLNQEISDLRSLLSEKTKENEKWRQSCSKLEFKVSELGHWEQEGVENRKKVSELMEELRKVEGERERQFRELVELRQSGKTSDVQFSSKLDQLETKTRIISAENDRLTKLVNDKEDYIIKLVNENTRLETLKEMETRIQLIQDEKAALERLLHQTRQESQRWRTKCMERETEKEPVQDNQETIALKEENERLLRIIQTKNEAFDAEERFVSTRKLSSLQNSQIVSTILPNEENSAAQQLILENEKLRRQVSKFQRGESNAMNTSVVSERENRVRMLEQENERLLKKLSEVGLADLSGRGEPSDRLRVNDLEAKYRRAEEEKEYLLSQVNQLREALKRKEERSDQGDDLAAIWKEEVGKLNKKLMEMSRENDKLKVRLAELTAHCEFEKSLGLMKRPESSQVA